MDKFSPIEQKIMRMLYQVKVPLTAYQVAKRMGISFPTAKKHLHNLAEKNIIIEDEWDGTYEKN
jgi:predicted ArsR family transcriptional regulator